MITKDSVIESIILANSTIITHERTDGTMVITATLFLMAFGLMIIIFIILCTRHLRNEEDGYDSTTFTLRHVHSINHDPAERAEDNLPDWWGSTNNDPRHPYLHPWLSRM